MSRKHNSFALRPVGSLASVLCLLAASPLSAQSTDAGVAASARASGPSQSVSVFVQRLSRMPAAELRAIIAPEGLSVCRSLNIEGENEIIRRRRCHVMSIASLNDTELVRLQRGWRFGTTENDSILLIRSLRCARTADRELCRALVAGPSGTNFEFRVQGTTRQLIRVTAWALSS